MDIEIKIGRGVEGANTCRVPSTYTKVSRNHAILYWHGGIAILEDTGSTNGTFVNGMRITKTQVRENDMVLLGGNGSESGCYQLDLRKFFASFRETGNVQQSGYSGQSYSSGNQYAESVNTQRTDYSREFDRIKQAYIDYHAQMSKLTKKANTRMQLPRVLLSLIPAILGIVIMIVATDMTMRIVGMSIGSVLSGLIGALTMGSGSSRKEKLTEDIMDLQFKYKKEYRCPKCGKEFGLDTHWKKLKADGKCPYGCGAQF